MISKMTKYSFILLSEGQETFLERLQELGVVDITRSSRPVDEKSSALLEKAGRLRTLTVSYTHLTLPTTALV